LEAGGKESLEFTHLLIGTMNVEDRFMYFKTHEVLASVEAFLGIDLKIFRYPPLRIKTEPRVLVLRRKDVKL
jgi:alpha-1,6-mannosyltransferase